MLYISPMKSQVCEWRILSMIKITPAGTELIYLGGFIISAVYRGIFWFLMAVYTVIEGYNVYRRFLQEVIIQVFLI